MMDMRTGNVALKARRLVADGSVHEIVAGHVYRVDGDCGWPHLVTLVTPSLAAPPGGTGASTPMASCVTHAEACPGFSQAAACSHVVAATLVAGEQRLAAERAAMDTGDVDPFDGLAPDLADDPFAL